MVDFVIFSFPDPLKDGTKKVEETYCNLLSRQRQGEVLHPEEIDYLDYANTVLSESK